MLPNIEPKQESMAPSITSTEDELELKKLPDIDCGWQAWLQVLGVHFMFFNTWGYVNSFGVFQSYYVGVLDATPSEISWIGSIQIFPLFFLGIFTGRALDAGYFRPLFLAGSMMICIGIFAASFTTNYWQVFLSHGLCVGIGGGMIYCPSMALCSTYFHKKKNLALGVASAGAATGGVILPLVVKSLLPAVGYAWAMRTMGLITFVCLGSVSLILKPRLRPSKSGSIVEWAAFKEYTYVFFAIGLFLNVWGLYFAFFYISAFARTSIGLSQDAAFTMVIIMNAVSLPGRLIPNYFADSRIGPLNILFPMSIIVGVLLFSWTCVHTYTGLVIWGCFYGFWVSGLQSLFPSTIGSLTTDLSKTGTRMGMVFTIASFACLTGPPIGGALVQVEGDNYWAAQLFAGLALISGALCLIASRVAKTGLVWRARA